MSWPWPWQDPISSHQRIFVLPMDLGNTLVDVKSYNYDGQGHYWQRSRLDCSMSLFVYSTEAVNAKRLRPAL